MKFYDDGDMLLAFCWGFVIASSITGNGSMIALSLVVVSIAFFYVEFITPDIPEFPEGGKG